MGTIETPWVRGARAHRPLYRLTSEHGETVTRSVAPCRFRFDYLGVRIPKGESICLP